LVRRGVGKTGRVLVFFFSVAARWAFLEERERSSNISKLIPLCSGREQASESQDAAT
jgi:hypothetical protein